MKKIAIVLALLILITGCQKTEIMECDPPQVKLNGKCCIDSNANYYCDNSEPEAPPIIKPAEPPSESQGREQGRVDLQFIEQGIYDAYYPLYRYEFNDEFRFNVSGFEATYEIRKADRFKILSWKEARDFSEFVEQKYDNTLNAFNEMAPEIISRKQQDPRWKDASFEYSHDLNKGDSSFSEKHVLIFRKDKDALDVEFEYAEYVECAPDIIVEISPREHWKFDYSPKYAILTVRKEIESYIERNRQALFEDATKIKRICSGEHIKSGVEPGTIELNVNEFIPERTTLALGESLKIHNNLNSNVVLVFTREHPRKQFVSQIIGRASVGSITLHERGNYSFFINGFNPKGRVEVS